MDLEHPTRQAAHRPLKVLRIYDHLGLGKGVFHGPGRAILRVTPELEELGVQTDVVFLGPYHASAEHFTKANVPCRFFGRAKWDLRSVFDILRALKTIQPDVLHLGGMKSLFLGRLAARLYPVPVVIHFHDTNPFPRPVRLASRLLVKNTTLSVSVSQHVGEYAHRTFGLPRKRMRTLYNGVNLSTFCPADPDEKQEIRESLELPGDAMVVCACGRLCVEKSIDVLLDAAGHLAKDLPRLHLLLVGDGPERAALESQARALGLADRVMFTGQRDAIPRILRAGDVLAMPTQLGEGFPNAALEALATGLPVIGARFGGLLEVIEEGINGLLAEPGDAGDLALALRRFFTDQDLRMSLTAQARPSVSAYAAEHYAQTQKVYYEDCVRLFGEDGGFKPGLKNKLAASWRKNVPELWALSRKGFPSFVTGKSPKPLTNELPVFCYHQLNKDILERDLAYLKENGYQTAGADEILEHVQGRAPLPPNTVGLTFDDGLRDLYEIAWPSLKAAGMKGMAFVCPGFVEAAAGQPGENHLLCDIEQLKTMEASGHMDIQSHGFSHRLLTAYPKAARLSVVPAWWQHRYRPEPSNLLDDLNTARERLESWLNKSIKHLCLVQYQGSDWVLETARQAGYEGFWWGAIPGKPDNRPGEHPERIVRISGDYVRTLPGSGRIAASAILKQRYF